MAALEKEPTGRAAPDNNAKADAGAGRGGGHSRLVTWISASPKVYTVMGHLPAGSVSRGS